MARRRRALRWSLMTLGGLLALIVLAASVALVTLQTRWGRQLVARQVERALNGILRGRVAIGVLEGNLLGRVIALDVVVTDRGGREAIRIARLEASYDLLALASKQLRLDDVKVIEPTLSGRWGPDGKLDLLEILPLPDAVPKPPSAWTVVVGHATVGGGKLALGDLHLDGIELALAVDQGGTRLRVDLDQARARWVEKDLVIEARGKVAQEGDAVRIDGVELRAGGSRVSIPSLRAGGGEGQAVLSLDVKRADVLRFLPDLPLRGDLTAAGTIRWTDPRQPLRAHLAGTLAGAPWALDADVGAYPPAASGTFHIDGVDPARMWPLAPAGKLSATVRASLAGASLATLAGTARVEASGELAGHALDAVVADVALIGGQLRGRVAVRATVARVGAVSGDLTVSGPLGHPKVAGVVRGTSLRYLDLRAASLVIDGEIAGLPRDVAGHIRIAAGGVAKGTARFGDVRAEGDVRDLGRHIDLSLHAGGPRLPYAVSARARIDRVPDGSTVVRVDELSVKTRRLVWNGSAGSVTVEPDGGVAVRRLSLASSAGRIQASGELRGAGDRLDLDVRGLRLEEIRAALAPDAPGLPDLRGTVDAHVILVQREHRLRQVQATVAARGLELRPTTDPISVDVAATLDGRDVKASLSVDGGLTGTVKIEVDTRAPVDPLDVAAWRRFDQRDLRKIHLDVARLDLTRLLDLLNLGRGPAGLVDATVDVGPGLSSLSARIATAGLVTAYVDAPLSGEVTLALAQGRLAVAGHARRAGGGEATLAARVAAPTRLWRVDEWARLDASAVEDVQVVLRDVEPIWWRPIRARFPDLEGKVSGTLSARARGDDVITADLRFAGVRAAPLLLPVSGRLRTSLYEQRITVELESSLGDRPLADVRGTIAAGLDAIRSGRSDAFLAAAASGKAHVKDFPVEVLRRALNLSVQASGALILDADVAGTVEHPVVDLTASLAGAHVGKVAFSRIDARGHLDPRQLTAAVAVVQEGGGSFQTEARVNLAEVGDSKLTLRAKRFDLGFLALFASERGFTLSKGFLDADLIIDGTLARHRSSGSLRLSGGDLRLTEMMGTLHEAGLDLTFGPGDAVALKLDTRVGEGGRLRVDGSATLVGLGLGEARGTFMSDKLSVNAGKTTAEVGARGSFTGAPQRGLYLLTATVDDGRVHLPKLGGGKVHPTGIPEDVIFVDQRGRREHVETGAGAPFLRIRLRTGRSIVVTSEGLRADLAATLDVTIAPGATTIRGQIRIEGGFVELFARRWSFQASTVELGGESPPDPRLDLRLSHEFRATTVTIAIGARLSKPELVLVASGDYDQAQLLGFVLGGSPDDGGPANDRDVSQQALGAGVGLVFGQLQPLLKKIVPVDVVSLQTMSGGKQDTVFSVGKWFWSDLFVAYQQRFGSQAGEQQNTYEGKLEWYFAHGFRLDLIFGDRGEGSADVLSVHRW